MIFHDSTALIWGYTPFADTPMSLHTTAPGLSQPDDLGPSSEGREAKMFERFERYPPRKANIATENHHVQ